MLHSAARSGNIELCSYLIAKGIDIDSVYDSTEGSAISIAAANGHTGLVERSR
ncbi:MAG: ankyrin repeat domain-containing protein [Planctomycetes bacterium]|nr:ankyrin repeat domain-containing protein [Planctomycetota bacterium]